jgi:hypothetical protein
VTGGGNGVNPVMSIQGSDGTRGFNFNTKGSSFFNFFNQSGTTSVFSAGGANTSNGNWISVVSGALGSPASVTSAGGDPNIDIAITPKGTGKVTTSATFVAGLISGGTF